jgi:hypothetical protein
MLTLKQRAAGKAGDTFRSNHRSARESAARPGTHRFLPRQLGNRRYQELSGLAGHGCSCGGLCADCRHTSGEEESGGIGRAAPGRPETAGVRADDEREERTGTSGSTSGNRIDIEFDPRTTSPTPQCDEIVFVQSIQMTADGTTILPGSYYTPWQCRDAVALADATYIDHDCACVTPYYTFCFNGTPGASNGVTVNATMIDAPRTGGGDRGFKSAANPGGWSRVVYEFETYAFCGAGTDCPTWYDGIAWTYTKTAADQAAGRDGVATGTASLLPPAPGATVIQAFDHFNSVKGFVPCTVSASRVTP